MTPYRDWFCEYGKYNGGDVFLIYDLISKIIGSGTITLFLNDVRIRTLLRVFHIPKLDRNMVSISKMSDVGVHIMFGKET
jgi:hypothetical protein